MTIGECGLQDAKKLTKIIIPNTLTTIETWGVRDCSALKNLVFTATSKLKTIGNTAFWGVGLETVTFPKSLETIGPSAFYCCSTLKKVYIENGSLLKTIGGSAFDQCTKFNEFKFNGSCTLETIGERAFADKTEMTYFDVPATVKTIGKSAFSGCTGIKRVTFPINAATTTISEGAFSNTGIIDMNLPANITTIGKEAFWKCAALSHVSLSGKVTSVSPEAFKACYKLKHIDVDKANQTYSSADGMMLTKDKKTLLIFPPGRANDEFMLLAPSITTIGDYSFYANDQLKNVTLPNKVAAIGKRAFGLCPNLNTVTFLCDEKIDPANIKQALNEAAFDDGVTTPTNVIKNINIHVREKLLTQYQQDNFYKKFKSITPSFVSGTEEYIPVSDNKVDMLSTKSENYTLVLPKTVTSGGKTYSVSLLGDYAFNGASNSIKEVVVPRSMEYIGAKAFLTDENNIGTSTVQNVFLLESTLDAETFSTTRFDLDDTGSDYSEFAEQTKVYVKKSAYQDASFQDAIKRYTEDATTYIGGHVRTGTPEMFSYKVPGIAIANTYGTFAREFDVDLSEFYKEHATGRVYAFTATDGKFLEGGGDGNVKGKYYVRFQSIANGDGTYIPAGTGVLLKSMDGYQTVKASDPAGEDFYYTIGEDDLNAAVTSKMVGVTEKNKTLTVADLNGTDSFYAIQGGLFKKLPTTSDLSVTVHKAYLQLSSVPAGAKLVIGFEDGSDDGTTSIEDVLIGGEVNNDAPVYDLQGRRVNNPTKGIYVVNGKKMVIK